MKHMRFFMLVLIGLFALVATAPLAHAQVRLVAQNDYQRDSSTQVEDPSVLPSAPIVSPEIFALDVPPLPFSDYVQITTSAVWQVFPTDGTPVRATFALRLELTSPALSPGMMLRFVVPMAFFRDNTGTGGGFQGGTSSDSEVVTRKLLAEYIRTVDPGLNEPTARTLADDFFRQGFHVSVKTQLRSQNVAEAVVINPNVAFFAEPGSNPR